MFCTICINTIKKDTSIEKLLCWDESQRLRKVVCKSWSNSKVEFYFENVDDFSHNFLFQNICDSLVSGPLKSARGDDYFSLITHEITIFTKRICRATYFVVREVSALVSFPRGFSHRLIRKDDPTSNNFDNDDNIGSRTHTV